MKILNNLVKYASAKQRTSLFELPTLTDLTDRLSRNVSNNQPMSRKVSEKRVSQHTSTYFLRANMTMNHTEYVSIIR
jgi:hypothetical protein